MYLVKPVQGKEVTLGGKKLPLDGIIVSAAARVGLIRMQQRGDITIELAKEEPAKVTKQKAVAPKPEPTTPQGETE